MKSIKIILQLVFVFSFMPQYLSAQFTIGVTPSGLITVRYDGCDPCLENYNDCENVIECIEECKNGFDFETAEEEEKDCWYDCYYDHPPGTYDCDTYCRELAYGEYDDCVDKCGPIPPQNNIVGYSYILSYDRAPIGIHPFLDGVDWTSFQQVDVFPAPEIISYQIPEAPSASDYCIRLDIIIYYADGGGCRITQVECFIFG